MYALASDSWDQEEITAINRVIASGQYTLGKEVSSFEDAFSSFLGKSHSVMTNSGSSANLVATFALRYSECFKFNENRNVVLVPAVSWSTTYFPLHQAGYKIRFLDVNLLTHNLSLEAVIKNYDETVCGICFVSLLGNTKGLEKIKGFCEENSLWLMEDNCESFGAQTQTGKLAGSVGDISTHSFFFSHHLQTMEGGMATTNNTELAMIARSMRAHGWTRDKKSGDLSKFEKNSFKSSFEFVYPGFCVRPIEFMGAVGKAQLSKWDGMLSARQKNASLFKSILKQFSNFIDIQDADIDRSSWFGFSMILKNKAYNHRDKLLNILDKFDIQVRPIVTGNFTNQPVMQFLNAEVSPNLVNSDIIENQGLFVGNDCTDLNQELASLERAIGTFIRDL